MMWPHGNAEAKQTVRNEAISLELVGIATGIRRGGRNNP